MRSYDSFNGRKQFITGASNRGTHSNSGPEPPDPKAKPESSRPSDLPKSYKTLRLREDNLPCFRVGDKLASIEEPKRELGDQAIDLEDEETNPWTPALRDKLIEEAR